MNNQRAVPPAPITPARKGGGFYPRSVSLTLPFPPSTNTYWRRNGGRYFIAKSGKAFREGVMEEAALADALALAGRLAVTIELFPARAA